MKRITLLAALFLAALPGLRAGTAQAAPNALAFTRMSLSPKSHLGQVTLTYHLTPTNRSANVGIQLFIHREAPSGQGEWVFISPKTADGKAQILNLYRGMDNTGSFTTHLDKGKYSGYRLIMFASPDGKNVNVGDLLYDSTADPHAPAMPDMNFTVTSSADPVISPVMTLESPEVHDNGDGTASVTINAKVRFPQDYHPEEGGFWLMAKGSTGFKQVWATASQAQLSSDPLDPYKEIPVQITFDSVKPGLSNLQFGLFRHSFGDPLQWVYPGMDIEVGGDRWEQRSPLASHPPRLRVKNRQFVTLSGKPYNFYPDAPRALKAAHFVRGGNYGNAINWTLQPALDTPGYFELLREAGCRFIRINFNPDRYPEPVYQHAVDQIIQNIWSAGLYPVVAPQDLPQGDDLPARIAKGERILKVLTNKYKGQSIWIELCNEPHEFQTWADWRPVALQYATAIRGIDPQAFIIAPFEGYSKDGRGAAKAPLPAGLVDLYDAHAYVAATQVASLYGPATKAGLPVLIGEFGGGANYLTAMSRAMQNLSPAPAAIAPWAFTIPGQDSLPLVADGSTAVLSFTPAGQAVQSAYASWDAGKKL